MPISLFIRWRVRRLFIRLFVCRVLLSVRLFIFPILEKFWLKSAVRRKMAWVSRNPFPQIMSLKHMHRSKLSEESSLARNQLRTNQFLDCVSYCNKQKSLILANSHFFSVQLQFTWLIQGMGFISLQSSIEIEKVTWLLLQHLKLLVECDPIKWPLKPLGEGKDSQYRCLNWDNLQPSHDIWPFRFSFSCNCVFLS